MKAEIELLKNRFKENFVGTPVPRKYVVKRFATTDPDFDHSILPDGIEVQIQYPLQGALLEEGEKSSLFPEVSVVKNVSLEVFGNGLDDLNEKIWKFREKLISKEMFSVRSMLKLIDKKIPEFLIEHTNDENDAISSMLNLSDQIILDQLQIFGLGYLHVAAIVLKLACNKCGLTFTQGLKPANNLFNDLDTTSAENKYIKKWCSNKMCNVKLEGKFISTILHQQAHASMGGLVSLDKSIGLVDMVLVSFNLNCLNCSKDSIVVNVGRGKGSHINCFTCHARLWVHFDNASVRNSTNTKPPEFIPMGKTQLLRPRLQNYDNAHLKAGQNLPNKGACEHYKHSYRWFRFPCCNHSFPCDICHEKGKTTPLCQPHVIATRQICGFCSHEQTITGNSLKGQECNVCAKQVGGKKQVGGSRVHWEGGKGCRDKNMLSVKDKKKYVNSKNKTRSAKFKRVGQEGSERANRKKNGT